MYLNIITLIKGLQVHTVVDRSLYLVQIQAANSIIHTSTVAKSIRDKDLIYIYSGVQNIIIGSENT